MTEPRQPGDPVPSDSGPVRAEAATHDQDSPAAGRKHRGKLIAGIVIALIVVLALAGLLVSRFVTDHGDPSARLVHEHLGRGAQGAFTEDACMDAEMPLFGILDDRGPIPAVNCLLIDGPFTGEEVGIMATVWTDEGAVDAVEDLEAAAPGDGGADITYVDLGGADGHDLTYDQVYDVMYDVTDGLLMRYQGFAGIEQARTFATDSGIA